MKNRSVFSVFTLVVVIFGLFAACRNPVELTDPADPADLTDSTTDIDPTPVTVPGDTLAAKLQWLTSNAKSNKNYLLEVSSDHEALAPQNLYYEGRSNIAIRLKGNSSNRVIEPSSKGGLFIMREGITLVLDDNITLIGRNDNDYPLIINDRGTLIVNTGVKISGNTALYDGGGVYVHYGTFIMNGGEISGNTSFSTSYYFGGGGVYVLNGTFIMNGGEISGNTASSYEGGGGGVYVRGGIFTMNGGEISGNIAPCGGGVSVSDGTFTMSGGKISGNTASSSNGGGVYVNGGPFTMSGGEISGNTATPPPIIVTSQHGGGVCVRDGTFTMSGGEISGNTASSDGGGVYVDRIFTMNGGTFTMSGGKISDNTVSNGDGGGVYMSSGTFTMNGGEISGNISSRYGGGVYSGTFTMSDGKISGNTVSPSSGYEGYGGGVYSGTFTMSGGEISGNTAYATIYGNGGGVYSGTFTMSGGEISGNTAYGYGGGVYVISVNRETTNYGTIIKLGGTITGYTTGDIKSNVVKRNNVVQNDYGHAVAVGLEYVVDSLTFYEIIKRSKETTAGPGDNLFYDAKNPPPVWSGAWDY